MMKSLSENLARYTIRKWNKKEKMALKLYVIGSKVSRFKEGAVNGAGGNVVQVLFSGNVIARKLCGCAESLLLYT